MSARGRLLLLLPSLAVLAAVLIWGFAGLPDFGHYRGPYGYVLNRVAVPERGATNVVAAVVFDYRGFDTMGEEFILFCAVIGVILLLRGKSEQPETSEDRVGSDALRVVGLLAVGPALVVGLWLAAFGYVTPGGGFQGGVAIAGALLLVYLAWSYRGFAHMATEHVVDPVEGLGAGGYVVIGLAALVSGLPFLRNLLGVGEPGTLWSAGSIGFLNWASAIEVAAANLLLMATFLQAYIVPLAEEDSEP